MKIDVKKVAKPGQGEPKLKLKGKAEVFVDWANVYGWKKSLRREVDPKKVFEYFKNYKEVQQIHFYYGEDKHPKSKQFLEKAKRLSYRIVTKPVKYILIANVEGQKLYRRKCDFDMEICIDVHEALRKEVDSFIFLSGDGDFEPLYKLLISQKKQVIVIYASGHLGREIWEIKKGLFKIQVGQLGL